ncbi:hypothetical protein ARMGADRAFT_1088234 [Armillaria gallica]|uniref:DUF6534 domain-containing protein n=1 Tax=Armillaria gallica TaxID=47427 RepID=A0A2H3D1X6_ARMGA|nr:hypothetical protein ARMGADRAFT_1088234 [Armillaria gallica]
MQPVPAGYPIAELSGPYIVGCLLNWGLFGTLSVQLYLYYLAFPNDRRFTKYLVYGIYVIEFAQTILVAHDAFATFGYGFGDMDALTRMNCNWVAVPVMSAIAAGVGQVFYAYRIFILSKSQIIPIFIICISLTSSVAAMVTGIYSFQAGNLTKMNNWKIIIAMAIWCGASPLCDIVIAICMTYYASSFSLSVIFIDVDAISQLIMLTTNFRRTQMLVTRIIRLTIETGSVTAVVALLNFVLFVAFPHQTSYITPGLLVPKLYANAVYMVLNSRFQIIGGRDTYMSSTDMSIPTMIIGDITSQSADGRQERVPAIVISNDYEMGQVNDKPQDSCMSLPA